MAQLSWIGDLGARYKMRMLVIENFKLIALALLVTLLSTSVSADTIKKESFFIKWVAKPVFFSFEEIEKFGEQYIKFAENRPEISLILLDTVKGEKFNCDFLFKSGCQKNILIEKNQIIVATNIPYFIACAPNPVTQYFYEFTSEGTEFVCLEDKDNDGKFESIFLSDRSRSHFGSLRSKLPSKKLSIENIKYQILEQQDVPYLSSYVKIKKYKKNPKTYKFEYYLMDNQKLISGLVSYRGNLFVTNQDLKDKGTIAFFEKFTYFALDNETFLF